MKRKLIIIGIFITAIVFLFVLSRMYNEPIMNVRLNKDEIGPNENLKVKLLIWNLNFKPHIEKFSCTNTRPSIEGNDIFEMPTMCGQAITNAYLLPFIPRVYSLNYKITTDETNIRSNDNLDDGKLLYMPRGKNELHFVWGKVTSKNFTITVQP